MTATSRAARTDLVRTGRSLTTVFGDTALGPNQPALAQIYCATDGSFFDVCRCSRDCGRSGARSARRLGARSRGLALRSADRLPVLAGICEPAALESATGHSRLR